MSDQTPPENEPVVPEPSGAEPSGAEPTAPLPTDEQTAPLPAFAPMSPSVGRNTRRTAIIAVVALVVAVVLGGGAFAVYKVFFAGGPQPAEVLPNSTIAVLTVDLNPSAGQKIAAIKAIRKFPALKKSLGLQSQDDLRKFIFDKAVEDSDCTDLSFEADVKPWVGKRAAIAAVDLGGKTPVPAIALQISDEAKARSGFEAISKCADFGSDFGFAVGKDYLIASDSTEHAKTILAEGEKSPLSEDAAYKKWTDEAGDQGVLNFYVAKKASDYLAQGLDELSKSITGGLPGSASMSSSGDGYGSFSGESAPRATDGCSDDPLSAIKDQLKGFQGLAGTVRFADGGMELSVATQGISQIASSATVGDKISTLPSDTAIALGIGIPKDYASKLVDSFRCGAGASGDDVVSQAEQETGLTLPGDLQTLLGSALTLSVGNDAPADLAGIEDPSDVPLGLVVHGDAERIKALIAKIEDTVGYSLSDIKIGMKSSGSRLVLSPSESYAGSLLSNGSLGSSSSFKDAVPDAKRDTGIFYIDFDSKWRETLIKFAQDEGASAHDVQIAEDNSSPLKSLGISTWTEGSTSHVLVKLATH